MERRIERRFSSQRIFGGLLSDTDSDSDDGGRRRGLQDGIENETQWKDTEEAIAKEMTRIKERPKPKHHWNFVDQVVQRLVYLIFTLHEIVPMIVIHRIIAKNDS